MWIKYFLLHWRKKSFYFQTFNPKFKIQSMSKLDFNDLFKNWPDIIFLSTVFFIFFFILMMKSIFVSFNPPCQLKIFIFSYLLSLNIILFKLHPLFMLFIQTNGIKLSFFIFFLVFLLNFKSFLFPKNHTLS